MTTTDDNATTAELSDELIFLIASASSDEQRRYAADLFRYFARKVALDAYRAGQHSMTIPSLPPPTAAAEPDQAPTTQPSDDHATGAIPPVRWQD